MNCVRALARQRASRLPGRNTLASAVRIDHSVYCDLYLVINSFYLPTEFLGCGDAVGNGGTLSTDGSSLCDMPCNGNSAEICGGPNGLTVYQYGSSVPTSGTGKRGLAYNNNNPTANAEYANLFKGYSSISWGYDWGFPSYDLDSSFELYVTHLSHHFTRAYAIH
jgi:hypothetical protein